MVCLYTIQALTLGIKVCVKTKYYLLYKYKFSIKFLLSYIVQIFRKGVFIGRQI